MPARPSPDAARGGGRGLERRLVPALVVAVAIACLPLIPGWSLVEYRLYDLFSTADPPRPEVPGATIVAIDEPSFAAIGRQWPWPRSEHARLVEALRRAGARAIALDIVFADPSTPDEDAALAAAMGPDVVLAAEETVIETPQATERLEIHPLPALVAAGAAAGIASVALDGDATLRRMPAYPDGFAARALAAAGDPVPAVPPGALIQFFGPPRTYPTVSYYQALEPESYLPADVFKDRIVFVGLALQHDVEASTPSPDLFETAYTASTHRLTAGAEVQATILDNIRTGLYAVAAPGWATVATVAFAVLIATAVAEAAAPLWRLAATVAAALAAIAACYLLLRFGRLWLSPALPVLAFAGVSAVRGTIDFAEERRRRRDIARAFEHYLAPALVERLAADPDALRLGGERRTLTVLFCDVRGFTTLAEGMKDEPERLTTLVNRLLEPLSQAVLDHGGTIDKFIGDCLMAFWNAPLAEPRHAALAVAAARAMQDGIARLNDALDDEARAEARPAVRIAVGVGINTGDCVVGNMGSRQRFAYTALGDAVNLASRLEGLSKLYAVPILIGEATAAAVGEGLVELDRVAVKGRAAPTAIFTATVPGSEAAATAQPRFLAAYRAGDWRRALAAAEEGAAVAPALAGYYARMAERILHLERERGTGAWDGVFVAEAK